MTDEDGSERYRLHLRDLETGNELADLVANTSGTVEWAEDGRTLLYVELNDSLRPFRVRAHRLGEDPSGDAVLYEESDPAFFVSIAKTRSRRFLLISSGTHVTREVYLLDALAPNAPPQLVAARREGHRYGLDHAHGRLWILTNDHHEIFSPGQRARYGAGGGELARGDSGRRPPLSAVGELLRRFHGALGTVRRLGRSANPRI